MMMNLLCPQCGQIDKVEKVSSVMLQHTSTTSAGPAHTTIASLLRPPVKASTPEPERGDVRDGVLAIILVILIVTGCVMLVSGGWPVTLGSFLLAAPIFAFLFLRKETQSPELFAEEAAYQAASEYWRKIYYCARCDGVFVPGEHNLTPSHSLQELLKEVGGSAVGPSRK
jgi:hypothetical protein